MDLPDAEFNPEEWREVLYARTRSPRQQSMETERTQSSKAASADGTQAKKTASAPSVPSEVDGTAAARLRIRPLPRLPVDDFKIVFRPTAGVNLAQYNDEELRAAVLANSGLHSAVAEEDLMCTNLPKNIFTVSTSCADRVANYAKIRDLTLRGNKLAFHAYIAPPDRARPGIIYRAWSGESPQDLLRELRRANPLLPIVLARDMGRTSRSVLIHFMAEELPPSVNMFGILYAVFNFRSKVEACVNCRQVGHRRDGCPLPNRLTCPGCGQKHPADHPCTPECVVCGDAHMTGDRACKKRFQRVNSRPSRPRQTQQQQQKQQQQHEFQLEKESFPRIADRNRGSGSKSPGRSESRSRDPGSQSGKLYLTPAETEQLNRRIRTAYKTALHLPKSTPTEKRLQLGLHNPLGEHVEAHLFGQYYTNWSNPSAPTRSQPTRSYHGHVLSSHCC
ncbi:hypothetical protein HPB49_010680 [Dermacentor silvarum]|uniref:Uncharacterized protein n=1 Tax=Dermacentor silvarum TaxID=543639 RepID=A0ACB8C318_DERSI|nr:hypothetical protein HPB49_010680 [Dermacentor silvarum]